MPDDDQAKDKANTLAVKRFEGVRRWLFVGLSLTAVGCAIARVSGASSVDRDVLFFLNEEDPLVAQTDDAPHQKRPTKLWHWRDKKNETR